MIDVSNASCRYGALVALDGVSIDVAPGTIVGLLGANGAGKSTLMRICAGLQTPDSGAVAIAGRDLWREPVAARRELGYMAEEPVFHDELSALEYLSFLAGARSLDPGEAAGRARRLLSRLGLFERAGEPIERYSHGMRKKLSFAAAALHRPRALLCDEALEGFDIAAAIAAREELASLAAQGTAVLFSSHVTDAIERQCDRAVILHRGRIARTLDRAEWGTPRSDISPLEKEFLMVLGSDSNREDQA